jgi:hypothetical protein
MNHFTDSDGFKAIGSQNLWTFEARQPPSDHPRGAYFTTLGSDAPNLSVRLRIPRTKLAFVFEFKDAGDLYPIYGGRGQFIFFSRADYQVDVSRQIRKRETGL